MSETFLSLHSLDVDVWDQGPLGLLGYTGSNELVLELFWKHFWVQGQENVGSWCSAEMETCQYPQTASESLQSIGGDPFCPLLCESFQVCECSRITIAGEVGGGGDAHLTWLPTLERRTQSLATPGPGLAASSFCCFSCCQRIFLGTNDSAT